MRKAERKRGRGRSGGFAGRNRSAVAKIGHSMLLVLFFLALQLSLASAAEVSILRSTSVEEASRLEAEQAVICAENYFAQQAGLELQQKLTILLVNGQSEYIDANIKFAHAEASEAARRARTTVAWVQGTVIISNVGAQPSARQRAFTIAHELAHHYQGEMAGGQAFALLWLTEGSADFWASHIVERMGYATVKWYRANWQAGYDYHFYKANVPDLSNLAARQDWYQALEAYGTPLTYRTADLAVFSLDDRDGEAGLFRYFRALGRMQAAPAAFEEAFDLTLPDFYRQFSRPLKEAA